MKFHEVLSDYFVFKCGLYVNFWDYWLMPFYFTMKRNTLSKNCYFGLRSPLKKLMTHARAAILVPEYSSSKNVK